MKLDHELETSFDEKCVFRIELAPVRANSSAHRATNSCERASAAGTDTGLEGKYDPQNGIAQLIRDKSSERLRRRYFEDEHVLVFMPLPEEEVVAPGHVLVVPKRLGARNLLDLKPDEMRDLARCGSKSWDRAEKWTGSNRFQSATK